MVSNVVYNESTGTYVAKGSSDDTGNSSTSSNENFGKTAEEIKADKVKAYRESTGRPEYKSKTGESAAELKSRINKDIAKRKQEEKQKQEEYLVSFEEGQFKGKQIKASEKFINKLEQINKQNNSNNTEQNKNEPIYRPYKNIPEYLKKKNINKDINIKPNVNQGTQEINQNYETQVDISTIQEDKRNWFEKNIISKGRAFFSSFKKGFTLDKDAGAIQQYGSNVESAGATLGTISRVGLGAKVAEVGGKGAGIGLARIKDSSKVAAKSIAIGQKVVKSKSLAVGLGTIYAGNVAVDTYKGVKEEGSIGGVRALSNALSDVTILGSFSKGVSEGYVDTRDIIFKEKIAKSTAKDTDPNFQINNKISDRFVYNKQGTSLVDSKAIETTKVKFNPAKDKGLSFEETLAGTIQKGKNIKSGIEFQSKLKQGTKTKVDPELINIKNRLTKEGQILSSQKEIQVPLSNKYNEITYKVKAERIYSNPTQQKDLSYYQIKEGTVSNLNELYEPTKTIRYTTTSMLKGNKRAQLTIIQPKTRGVKKPKIESKPKTYSEVESNSLTTENKVSKDNIFLIKPYNLFSDSEVNTDNITYDIKFDNINTIKPTEVIDNKVINKFKVEKIDAIKSDSKISTIPDVDTKTKTKLISDTKAEITTEQIPFTQPINIKKPKIIDNNFKPNNLEPKKDKFNINKFNVNTLRTKKVSKSNFTGFNVLVKKQGRFQQINKQLLSKSSALNLGYSEVDRTASATFKIIPKFGKINQRDLRPESILSNKFYKKGNLYIEKNKYRIDTPGEKKGITFKSKKKKTRFL